MPINWINVSRGLSSLKGGYVGDSIGTTMGGIKEEASTSQAASIAEKSSLPSQHKALNRRANKTPEP